MPPLLPSTLLKHSEFDKTPTPFDTCMPNQCSTILASSGKAELRLILGGTSYSQIRLAFYPYTQVRRMLWKAIPLQASMRALTPISPCPSVDHLASGMAPVTTRTFIRCASLPARLLLSLWILSYLKLSLPLRQTPCHIIRNRRCNPGCFLSLQQPYNCFTLRKPF